MSPKEYFAKNLELCGSRNLLFSTAASATKLQFGGFYSCFVALAAVLNNKFLGTQISKFLAKHFFGLTIVHIIYDKNIPDHFKIDIEAVLRSAILDLGGWYNARKSSKNNLFFRF